MPNFTKKAIRESFIKLLNERPLNKITVKDIVEDCGVNRNSFYYHYQDLPALLEEIVSDEVKRIVEQYQEIGSIEDCFRATISFALKNRRAVLHIYKSMNREYYDPVHDGGLLVSCRALPRPSCRRPGDLEERPRADNQGLRLRVLRSDLRVAE